jgi:hypothetical protein
MQIAGGTSNSKEGIEGDEGEIYVGHEHNGITHPETAPLGAVGFLLGGELVCAWVGIDRL